MRRLRRRAIAAAATLTVVAAGPAHAQQGAHWRPDSVYVQASGGERVAAIDIGAGWDWRWSADFARGTLTARTDLHLARWHVTDNGGFTRIGVTPVLRYVPRGGTDRWFIEAGIGINAITPRYRNGPHWFSTTLNFGDQVAVGRRFGAAQDQELSLRLEHLSNGDIRKPNPGENLLQLRYTRRF